MNLTPTQQSVVDWLAALPNPYTVTITERTKINPHGRSHTDIEIEGGTNEDGHLCGKCKQRGFGSYDHFVFRWHNGRFATCVYGSVEVRLTFHTIASAQSNYAHRVTLRKAKVA